MSKITQTLETIPYTKEGFWEKYGKKINTTNPKRNKTKNQMRKYVIYAITQLDGKTVSYQEIIDETKKRGSFWNNITQTEIGTWIHKLPLPQIITIKQDGYWKKEKSIKYLIKFLKG